MDEKALQARLNELHAQRASLAALLDYAKLEGAIMALEEALAEPAIQLDPEPEVVDERP